MRKYSKKGFSAIAVGALTCGLMAAGGGTAHADLAPTSGDVVGVGSDTLQYMLDFGADGDATGDLGYNSGGNANRLVSFDATADANARAAYLPNSTQSLSPTIVLRAGSKPVQRPNGSSSGIAALEADSANKISFIRASRPLKSGEATTSAEASTGPIRVVQLATDDLAMATANTTNAPALSKAELAAIYTCNVTTWRALNPSNTALSLDTIVPIIPQVGSGTRSTFESDIGVTDAQVAAATIGGSGTGVGGVGGTCVHIAEENDPFSIYINSTGSVQTTAQPDTIAPMSGGRLKLFQHSYFNDPTVAYGVTPVPLAPTVSLVTTGTAPDGTAAYDDNRGLFVMFRQSDATDAAWQAGGSKNWANVLFIGTNPYFNTNAGKALLTAAGVTPNYVDEGTNFTG